MLHWQEFYLYLCACYKPVSHYAAHEGVCNVPWMSRHVTRKFMHLNYYFFIGDTYNRPDTSVITRIDV